MRTKGKTRVGQIRCDGAAVAALVALISAAGITPGTALAQETPPPIPPPYPGASGEAQTPKLKQRAVPKYETVRTYPPEVTTEVEGRFAAAVARHYIGKGRFEPDGDTLGGEIGNAQFVSQTFKTAGVYVPDPPAENMMRFGKAVAARAGVPLPLDPDALPRKTQTPPPLTGTTDTDGIVYARLPDGKQEELRDGDRLFFEGTGSDGKPAHYTGIYTRGREKERFRHGVVLITKATGTVALVDMMTPPYNGDFRLAVRGWTYRDFHVTLSFMEDKASNATKIATKPEYPGVAALGVVRSAVTYQPGMYLDYPIPALGSLVVVSVGVGETRGNSNPGPGDDAQILFEGLRDTAGSRWKATLNLLLTPALPAAPPERGAVEAAIGRAADGCEDGITTPSADTLVVYLTGPALRDGIAVLKATGTTGGPVVGLGEFTPLTASEVLEGLLSFGVCKVVLLLDYDDAVVEQATLDRLRAAGKDVAVVTCARPNAARPIGGRRFAARWKTLLTACRTTEGFALADTDRNGVLTVAEVVAALNAGGDGQDDFVLYEARATPDILDPDEKERLDDFERGAATSFPVDLKEDLAIQKNAERRGELVRAEYRRRLNSLVLLTSPKVGATGTATAGVSERNSEARP